MGFRSLLGPKQKIMAKITGHIQNLISALEAVHVPRSQRASTQAASNFSTSNGIAATCSILSFIGKGSYEPKAQMARAYPGLLSMRHA